MKRPVNYHFWQISRLLLEVGVQDCVCCIMRFFTIFSQDTVTAFSCSILATSNWDKRDDGTVENNQLSCAKVEGWGQTIDLIVKSK